MASTGDEPGGTPRVQHGVGDVAMDRLMHGWRSVHVGPPCHVTQPAVGRDQDPLLLQPPSCELHQAIERDRVMGFASPMHHQHPLPPLRERANPPERCGPRVVVEPRLTAVVQSPERGPFGDLEAEVSPQMASHPYGKGVEGIQRAPGHLDKPHRHSGGEPVVVPIA